ncbi:MAG TPA: DedA family protein [Gaiellaceae bacterium]|nr:DedA family protein [Gaiellaceae bacterium]
MLLASVSSSFTSEVASHGVYAVFALMAIDAVFPAFSELVMLYGGAVAAGVFSSAHGVDVFGAHVPFGLDAYLAIAFAGTLGYLAGSFVGWGIGRYGGRPLLERHGRWFHLTPARLDRAEAWFERWGTVGVLFGRITPVVRSFVSIPAGVFGMRLAPYTALTLAGSALWAFGIAGAGYGLGTGYERFDEGFKYVEYAVVAGIVAGLAYLLYRGVRAATVTRHADDSAR